MQHRQPPSTPSTLCRALLACGLVTASLPLLAQSEPASGQSAARANAAPESIVITATRRAERIQEVPLAVTAVTGSDLAEAGVKDLTSLQFVVPGLQVGDTPNDKGFRIRGVGSLTGTYVTGQELPVGVVIDGVIQGLGAGLSNLADVERIEVLKGPQGTQFGKNSAAGMVSVSTVRPRLGKFEGNLAGSFGSRGEQEVRAGLNLPLGASAAARVTVFNKGYDDFVTNLSTGTKVGGDKQSGGRLRVLLAPSKDFDAIITADASKQDINSGSQLWTVNASTVPQAGITYGLGNLATRELRPGQRNYDRSGLSLEMNWRAGGYTFTSLTATRKLDEADFGSFGQGYSAVPFPPFTIPGSTWWNQFDYAKKQTTQEFRVTSPRSDGLEYVAGVLYYNQPTRNQSTGGIVNGTAGWVLNPQNGLTINDTTTVSKAVFADGKFRMGPTVALLGGMRYTKDDVESNFSNTNFDGGRLGSGFAFRPASLLPAASKDASASKGTGKLGVEWKASKNQLVFATVSTGYLGPIVNWGWATGTSDVLKPQTNTNFTLGLKSESADRRLTFNANIFKDSFQNFQTGFFQSGRTVQFRAENAAALNVQGVEADLTARMENGLFFTGAMALARARFGDYCSGGAAAAAAAGQVAACTTALGFAGGNNVGLAPPGAPDLTSNLGVGYGTMVAGEYFLKGQVSRYYRSKTRNSPTDSRTELPGYSITNLSVSLSPSSDRWMVGVYARNLGNTPFAGAVMSSSFAPSGTYVNWVTRESQRTVGANVEFRF